MRNLLTTQNQNCYTELIMKEAYTRLTWKSKYGKDYPTSFTSRRAKTMGLFNPPKPPTQITLPPVVQPVVQPQEKQEKQETQEKKKQQVPVLVGRTLSEAPLMRPVSPHTKDALYQGLSKEGKGRSMYLRRRVQKMPEEKFDYPILSSWEYGWRLGDYDHNYKSPANGRSGVVRSSFYARNGIFNLPSQTDKLV
ncbi:protein ATP6V1FNB [Astyanax mexicanus]|uniref:protein ATP6V1FNB n=1 Tax=Astyanax mexicanus TaxID=7994 RepID=UPI0020CAF2A0|nr:protein ATP6V1FNB [Astyanax mexicanus]